MEQTPRWVSLGILALRFIVPAIYLLVSSGYVYTFIKARDSRPSWIRLAFLAGLFLHTLLLALLFLEHGVFPFGTVIRGLFFCSWVLAVMFLAMENLLHEISYGAFFMPVNFIVTAFTLSFLNAGVPLPRLLVSYYFIIHVSLLFTAYACFLFSFLVSLMYLLQHAEIKARRPGAFFTRLPSLEIMDQTIRFMDGMGLSLILLGIITGFLWLDAYNMTLSSNIPVKAGFVLLTFIIYLSEHLLRIGKGWKGQRACLVSILGFLFVLCTLIVGRHGY
jgi:ABC-type transport system involved in cytochrome c biogenesis permease subunit